MNLEELRAKTKAASEYNYKKLIEKIDENIVTSASNGKWYYTLELGRDIEPFSNALYDHYKMLGFNADIIDSSLYINKYFKISWDE